MQTWDLGSTVHETLWSTLSASLLVAGLSATAGAALLQRLDDLPEHDGQLHVLDVDERGVVALHRKGQPSTVRSKLSQRCSGPGRLAPARSSLDRIMLSVSGTGFHVNPGITRALRLYRRRSSEGIKRPGGGHISEAAAAMVSIVRRTLPEPTPADGRRRRPVSWTKVDCDG